MTERPPERDRFEAALSDEPQAPLPTGAVRRIDRDLRPRRAGPVSFHSMSWALALGCGVLGALFIAAWSGVQVTEQGHAEPLQERTLAELTELDAIVRDAWPQLIDAAAADPSRLVLLPHYPLAVPVALRELPSRPLLLRDRMLRDSATLVYEQGLDAFGEGGGGGIISSRGVFRFTIGHLTADGHEIALVTGAVTAALFVPLFLLLVSIGRGLERLLNAGLALAIAPAGLAIAALLFRSVANSRAGDTADPFTAQLWLIGADTSEVLLRNAAIAAVLGGVFLGLFALGRLAPLAALIPIPERFPHRSA